MRPGRGSASIGIVPDARTLLWSDDFDGAAGSLLNGADWSYNVGRWGSTMGELQYYTNATAANCAMDGNSNLVINAIQENPPDSQPAPQNFTSARVLTQGKHEFSPTVSQPIRIAARMKAPRAKGLLPAFWSIGNTGTWPATGEIDFMELPSHQGDNVVSMHVHGPTNGSPSVDKDVSSPIFRHINPLIADFHVYGVDWYTDRVVWHFDNAVIGQVTQAQYTSAGGDWTPLGGAWGFYIIFNVAIGNSWTGAPDDTSVWPQTMTIDWVKVWNI
jgi:beta-glucanase (GH16 family)